MKILVTGSSGYIGHYLSRILEEHGHTVLHLSRKKCNMKNYFSWNIKNKQIDEKAIELADAIIHLAGENIGSGRWTKKRKLEIEESRVKGTQLLIEAIKGAQNKPKIFISASATGYYGAVTEDKIYTEADKPKQDFLGKTTSAWEKESLKAKEMGIRTVILRTGVVFSTDSEALKKMTAPIKLGIGANLGSGKQYIPWIHLHDLAMIYLYAIENQIEGVYNAVAPEHTTQKELNKQLAKQLKRPLFLPAIPELILRIILGEMAVLVTRGSKVSSDKIEESGFIFKYRNLGEALKNSI